MGDERLLDRVRKLLAKAEDESCTPQEAEALTAKAAELMAKYGIDQALLDATKRPEDNKPIDRVIPVDDPYARVKRHLLGQLAVAMGCKAVYPNNASNRVHVFGYQSDIERVELLYTSLLLQMANGLVHTPPPSYVHGRQLMAWRRSWMLGFISAVISRVMTAEERARKQAEAEQPTTASTPGAALVLADRALQVKAAQDKTYPELGRPSRMTYRGGGYRDGHAAGQRANLGGTGVGRQAAGAISG